MSLLKKLKFTFLGYDFLIQPSYFSKLHYTLQTTLQTNNLDIWQYHSNMDKRIYALCGDHRLIEYVFRDLDISILTYGCDVGVILSRVMQGFSDIRVKLVNNNASSEQLKIYDNKIHEQFDAMLKSIYSNALKDPTYMPLYNTIKDYDVRNYHVNETSRTKNKKL